MKESRKRERACQTKKTLKKGKKEDKGVWTHGRHLNKHK